MSGIEVRQRTEFQKTRDGGRGSRTKKKLSGKKNAYLGE